MKKDPTDLLDKNVVAYTAGGEAYRAGRVISYCDVPSFSIEDENGVRFSWRADLVRPVNPSCSECGGTGLVGSRIIPGDKAPCQACVDAPEVETCTCRWTAATYSSGFTTSCEAFFKLYFDAMCYCPFCGKPIEITGE